MKRMNTRGVTILSPFDVWLSIRSGIECISGGIRMSVSQGQQLDGLLEMRMWQGLEAGTHDTIYVPCYGTCVGGRIEEKRREKSGERRGSVCF